MNHIFMDNTGPLASLRRRDLAALAKKHGVPISESAPAYQIREALKARNVVPDMPEPPVEAPDLEGMSLFDLRKVCKERDIPYKMTDKKADLLMKLG